MTRNPEREVGFVGNSKRVEGYSILLIERVIMSLASRDFHKLSRAPC